MPAYALVVSRDAYKSHEGWTSEREKKEEQKDERERERRRRVNDEVNTDKMILGDNSRRGVVRRISRRENENFMATMKTEFRSEKRKNKQNPKLLCQRTLIGSRASIRVDFTPILCRSSVNFMPRTLWRYGHRGFLRNVVAFSSKCFILCHLFTLFLFFTFIVSSVICANIQFS